PSRDIGLPEAALGLVPACGGATRLPRRDGAEVAAEVILKGKLYGAEEALRLGLADEVTGRDQLREAARKKLGGGKREASAPKSGMAVTPPATRGNAAPGRAYEIIQHSGDSSI